MVNVLVTNGTVEEEPWRALLPLIDAANIDLKQRDFRADRGQPAGQLPDFLLAVVFSGNEQPAGISPLAFTDRLRTGSLLVWCRWNSSTAVSQMSNVFAVGRW